MLPAATAGLPAASVSEMEDATLPDIPVRLAWYVVVPGVSSTVTVRGVGPLLSVKVTLPVAPVSSPLTVKETQALATFRAPALPTSSDGVGAFVSIW
ncbi:MAG: hypothetical protein FAZ92_02731 [Accumulibacter sp.]|nr:MAG: hypothetical protein FAZ92_02731 [Accumulibacter sp.]